MPEYHYHIDGLCRHCAIQQTHAIAETLEDAETALRNIPELFDKQENPSEFRNATYKRIAENIYHLQWDKHDIIMTSIRCTEPYAECYIGFMHHIMERQTASIIQQRITKESDTTMTNERLRNLLKDFGDELFGTDVN